jgi:ABC-type nitrate/sulfonate/bicarbonate transport system substrate-binding protein
MKIYRLTRRAAMKAIGAGVLSPSNAPRASWAQTPPKILLATQAIAPALASYIGQTDFFKAEGLTVETTRFNSFAPILQGMTAGGIVVGEIGVAPGIIGLARGLPVLTPFLGAFVTPNHPLERIMVLPNSPIKTLDDLKGKKLAFLGPGTVPDMMLDALPRKSAISKQDIQLLPMPPPSMPDALGQGQVDAIFAIPPGDGVAESKYAARTIANATELVPYVGLSTVAVRRDFAEEYPDATRKLFRALIRLSRWIGDNPGDARKVMAKNLGLPDDLASRTRIPLFARNGLPVMPNVWNLYEMILAAKTIDPPADPAKLFNQSIVEPVRQLTLPAVEAIGLQPDPDIESMLRGDYPFLTKPAAAYYADWEHRLLKT